MWRRRNSMASRTLCLGLFAKPFIEEKPVFLAGIEEFADGFDLHFLPDGGDFLWAEAFDLEHFDDAGRGFGDILLKSLNSPVSRISWIFLPIASPMPLMEVIFVGGDVRDGGREFFEGEGGDGIRFCFKGIFAVDVHEFGEEAELFGDIVVVDCHRSKLRKWCGIPDGGGVLEDCEKQKSRNYSGTLICSALWKK